MKKIAKKYNESHASKIIEKKQILDDWRKWNTDQKDRKEMDDIAQQHFKG